jgi:hypothetical protein
LSDRPVSLAEVWSKENVEERAGNALDSVRNGENGNTLSLHLEVRHTPTRVRLVVDTHIFDVWARMDRDDIAVLHTQVVANNAVQTSAAVVQIIVGKNDQDSVLPLLSADEDRVTAEQLESVHGVVRQGDDGVVIVDGIGNHQLVGLLLLLENSRGRIIVLSTSSQLLSSRDREQAQLEPTYIFVLGTGSIMQVDLLLGLRDRILCRRHLDGL